MLHLIWSVVIGVIAYFVAKAFTSVQNAKIIGVVVGLLVFLGLFL